MWIGFILIAIAIALVAFMPNGSSGKRFTLTSSAFADGASIPKLYSCEGSSISPPLSWMNAPAGTKSFALVLFDPDVPTAVLPAGFFNHWEVFNIPASATSLDASSTLGTQGNNGSGKLGYTGPCPPPQFNPKEHRYVFTVYALDTTLSLPAGADRNQIEGAMADHILGEAQLIGKYQKVGTTAK